MAKPGIGGPRSRLIDSTWIGFSGAYRQKSPRVDRVCEMRAEVRALLPKARDRFQQPRDETALALSIRRRLIGAQRGVGRGEPRWTSLISCCRRVDRLGSLTALRLSTSSEAKRLEAFAVVVAGAGIEHLAVVGNFVLLIRPPVHEIADVGTSSPCRRNSAAMYCMPFASFMRTLVLLSQAPAQ